MYIYEIFCQNVFLAHLTGFMLLAPLTGLWYVINKIN